MITFENRILYEYKIKKAKIDTLANSILTHRTPKGSEAKATSDFLDILIDEIDRFYEEHSEILSNNGKSPHPRSRLPENKSWSENIEKFYEKNPKRRPKK